MNWSLDQTSATNQKSQHTTGIRIAGAAGLKLFCAFPLRWNGLCPFVWPQIILETVSMIGGGLLRADKYHTRKVCQAVIFRLRNCTTRQLDENVRLVGWRI